MDHNGDIHNYPDDLKPNKLPDGITVTEAWNALKVSMGVFGIVVEMTVEVKPLSTARVENHYPTLGALLYGSEPKLLDILRKNWSVQMMWFPFNSLGLVGGIIEGLPLLSIWQPRCDEVWLRVINKDTTYTEANW